MKMIFHLHCVLMHLKFLFDYYFSFKCWTVWVLYSLFLFTVIVAIFSINISIAPFWYIHLLSINLCIYIWLLSLFPFLSILEFWILWTRSLYLLSCHDYMAACILTSLLKYIRQIFLTPVVVWYNNISIYFLLQI